MAMVIFFFSSQTYEEQSISPLLSQFNTPYWYDRLIGISFMYGGVEVSVQTAGVNGFLEFFLRKGAHLFIFFVFGLLTYGVWRRFVKNPVLSFSGAFLCVLFYASTDELHQKLTGGRTPLWQDVMLDTCWEFSFFLSLLSMEKSTSNNMLFFWSARTGKSE
ncbi:VanZ family protein [Peribacillus simplex]|uniref:VanZ family protein n=1 Tax=Peribacillus simplex TaxID=1478 RepID=UPI003D276DBB